MRELVLNSDFEIEEQNEILKGLYWIDPELGEFQFDREIESKPVLRYNYRGERPVTDIESEIESVLDNIFKSRIAHSQEPIFKTDFGNKIHSDTYSNLIESGMLKKAANGVYLWRGFAVNLFKSIDSWILSKARNLGFDEWITPNIVSAETLNKTGYLKNFPQHVHLLCHLPEDSSRIRQARDQWAKLDDDGRLDHNLAENSSSEVLSPTVCCHVFQAIEGINIEEDAPLLVTSMNSCYRHEGRSTQGLHRLSEFHMRELVAIGQKQQVSVLRDKYIKLLEQIMISLCLDGIIDNASDPFFFDSVAHKRFFQKNFQLKQEMQVKIDSEQQFSAAGSVNYHQDYFGNCFNITSSHQTAWSTCVGFGIDRICYALFSQHGLNPSRWEPSVINNLNISL